MGILSTLRFAVSPSLLVRCTSNPNSTVDPKEIAFYNQHAAQWWDPTSQFVPLLHYNRVRIPFIEKQLERSTGTTTVSSSSSVLKDVRILDVGCGGGYLSEGLAEKGAIVIGIDVSEETVKVNKHNLDTHCWIRRQKKFISGSNKFFAICIKRMYTSASKKFLQQGIQYYPY